MPKLITWTDAHTGELLIRRINGSAKNHDPGDEDNPRISDLQQLNLEQTRDEIRVDGHICQKCREPFIVSEDLESTTVCNGCAQWFVSEIGPMLLEIAKTALAWQKAVQKRKDYGFAASGITSSKFRAAATRLDAAADKRLSQFLVALAKIKP